MRRFLAIIFAVTIALAGGSGARAVTNPLNFSTVIGVAAPGTVSTLTPGFVAYSMTIDNPSGMWLFVQPIMRWVPPYTLAWRASLPGTQNPTVAMSNAPVGAPTSVQSGGPVVVNISSADVDDYAGEIYNLITVIGTLDTDIVALDTKIDLTNTTLATTNTSLTTVNTNLGTLHSDLGTLNTSVNTVNTTLGSTNTKLDTLNTSVTTVNTTLGSTNTKLDTLHNDLGALNTSVTTVNTTLTTTNVNLVALTAALNAMRGGYGSSVTPLSLFVQSLDGNGIDFQLIAAPGAGKQIVIVGWHFAFTTTSKGLVQHGNATALLGTGAGLAGGVKAMSVVSPENPQRDQTYAPESLILPANTALRSLIVGLNPGDATAGTGSYMMTMEYYIK